MLRRSPLARHTPLRRAVELEQASDPARRSRFRPVSARRQAENRRRRQVVAALAGADPWCQARLPGICAGLAADAHEVLTRARGGDITDPDNIRLLCRPCHRYVTTHPAWANEAGWTVPSWAAVPHVHKKKRVRRGGTPDP